MHICGSALFTEKDLNYDIFILFNFTELMCLLYQVNEAVSVPQKIFLIYSITTVIIKSVLPSHDISCISSLMSLYCFLSAQTCSKSLGISGSVILHPYMACTMVPVNVTTFAAWEMPVSALPPRSLSVLQTELGNPLFWPWSKSKRNTC